MNRPFLLSIPKAFATWWIDFVKSSYAAEIPDNLTTKGWLCTVDPFSNMHLRDTQAIIAIGGEAKKNPTYPSSTIAQMILWALRKQEKFELPITVALNLLPALEFNEIDKENFYAEKEQRIRIIRDLKLFWATKEELERVRFDLSTENPQYSRLVESIKSHDLWECHLYKKIFDAFGKNTQFACDIRKCVPEQVKNNREKVSSFHYALIEIHEIIESYKRGQKIKIGYKREKLYDRIFLNVLDGRYPELADITSELSVLQQGGGESVRGNEMFWSVYWDEKANRNSARLKEKLMAKKRLRQILYATPLIVWAIAWWQWYQYEIEKVREHAYEEALWEQGRVRIWKFSTIDELDKQAKRLDYESKFFLGLQMTYVWKDVRIKVIHDISVHIVMGLNSYMFWNIQNVHDSEIYNSEEVSIRDRWAALELARILEEPRFKLHIDRYDPNIGFLKKELYDEITSDPRFAIIFNIYTGKSWKNTPEFKKEIFYFYSR